MPNKIRAYWCEDCGAWTLRKRKSNDPRVCEPCGLDRRRNAWANNRRRHKLERQAEDPPPTCAR